MDGEHRPAGGAPTRFIVGWFNIYDGEGILADAVDFDAWRWSSLAACRNVADPDAFFQPERQTDRKYLSRICDRCEVKTECLDYALIHDEQGWWGGTTREDRRALIRAILRGEAGEEGS